MVRIRTIRLRGWNFAEGGAVFLPWSCNGEKRMDAIIYLVGLVVVIMAILSFLGLR
jgi:hypothetical protein